MSSFDQEIMARTAMGEARGEGEAAMVAVMWTGLNRFNAKKWFSALTLAGTFLRRMQYDCWRPEDVNYAYIINISSDIGLFRDALGWAAQIITAGLPDPTDGATHYYDSSISPPHWVDSAIKTVTIGKLTFFKNVK
jgi:N-acetylmuramoyl-L-alanine amidase